MKIYNTKNIWQFESTMHSIAGKLQINIDMSKVSGNCHRVKLNLGPTKKYLNNTCIYIKWIYKD